MKIKQTTIEIDSRYLEPTLVFGVEIDFFRDIQAPILLSGHLLSTDGKILEPVLEYKVVTENNYPIKLFPRDGARNPFQNKYSDIYYAKLSVKISKKSIEHIEVLRLNDVENSVRLNLNLIIRLIELEETSGPFQSIIQYKTENLFVEHVIKQSDWIRNFSPQLGIGNFLLVELKSLLILMSLNFGRSFMKIYLLILVRWNPACVQATGKK